MSAKGGAREVDARFEATVLFAPAVVDALLLSSEWGRSSALEVVVSLALARALIVKAAQLLFGRRPSETSRIGLALFDATVDLALGAVTGWSWPFLVYLPVCALVNEPRGDRRPWLGVALVAVHAAAALHGRMPPLMVVTFVALAVLVSVISRAHANAVREAIREAADRDRHLEAFASARRRACEAERAERERIAAVGLYAASVAHEIANPAAAVLGNLDLLSTSIARFRVLVEGIDEGVDIEPLRRVLASMGGVRVVDEANELTADVIEAANRIREITRDMRVLAQRGGSGPKVVDVNESIRSSLRLARAMLKHRVATRTVLAEGLKVRGEAGLLSSVFFNLVVNAVHSFGTARRPDATITVTSRCEGDRVVVDVCDNGSGIAPENLPRVFDRFFTTKGPEEGTGLGLAICREILDGVGATISVSSELGRGTCFTITLPCVIAPANERLAA